MSRDRFKFLANNLTYGDNSFETRKNNQKKYGKFYKMYEIFEIFKKNLDLMHPSSRLCIDEELYACKCRFSFKQFMKNKPAKYCIKYWLMVCAETQYLLSVDVYLGKTSVESKKETEV